MTTSNKYMDMDNADIELLEEYFDPDLAEKYYSDFENNILWKQETMNMYGKEVNFARLMAWYGNAGKKYKFSGTTHTPNDWSENKYLMDIKDQLEIECNQEFNSVLCNKYRDGKDSISWHTDAEKELGINPVICSVSLGCERIFAMRRMDDNKIIKKIPLTHNSLLIMKGETQHYWQHQIAKTNNEPEISLFNKYSQRINLTFRYIYN